ncbi:MAG: response regulator [Myxococcota bacterium]
MERYTSDLLLVEDNQNDIMVAMRAFRLHGLEHRVTVLRDGAAALDYLTGAGAPEESEPLPLPKVILLDLRMPRIDGREVLRHLRTDTRTKGVPVVIVSSSQAETDIRDCYDLGANSFVVKTFDAKRPGEYLVDVARYWLNLNRVAE